MTAHPIPENAGHWWLACGIPTGYGTPVNEASPKES